MKIAIDFRNVCNKIPGGIGKSTYNIFDSVFQYSKENKYFLFSKKKCLMNISQISNTQNIIIPISERLNITQKWLEEYFYVWLADYIGIDIFHFPDHYIPEKGKFKKVVTIHDLAPIVHPLTKLEKDAIKYKIRIEHSCKYADKIITVSNFTKSEIQRVFGINSEKISVIYNGVGDSYKRINDYSLLRMYKEKLNLPSKFMLHVGTIEPRKNIKLLIDALILLLSNQHDIYLVLVGKLGWKYDCLLKYIEENKLKEKVIILNSVDEKTLPIIYNLATVFVYSSIYEGFGMPLVEAMACGVPVLAAMNSSIPEIIGDAGVLFENNNISDFYENILKILNNQDYSELLREKGIVRAKKYNWNTSAHQLINIYSNMILRQV